ncbi:MAG: MotA/TolQ/ExbB proton channel family protein [Planctomycetota bacterium]|nr:MotA/TolQ/ExbB proton channel family protein [Planctomycetota bacterium]
MRRFVPFQLSVLTLSVLFLLAGVTTTLLPPAVVAQDDAEADPEQDPVEEPAAPAAAEGEPAAEEPQDADAPGGNERSYLGWLYDALGLGYMFIFLALSFTLVALGVMNFLSARRDNVCPIALLDAFEQLLNDKQYQEAYEMAKADESFLGQVLSAGLAKLSAGYPQALEAMQERAEEETMKLEHRLSYMALIGTISPMIGLFGTVHGMVASFQVIATASGTPKPSQLAEGISTALFTTLLGLGIAIPAIVAFNLLKNQISKLVLEVGIDSESLMSRFENVGPGAAKK